MSAPHPRSSGSVKIRTNVNRIGTPAACILVTILAANQASTRSHASLPYLVQGAPQALRFAQAPPTLPPPVRPWEIPPPAKPELEHETTLSKRATDPHDNAHAGSHANAHSGSLDNAHAGPSTPAAIPTQPTPPSANENGGVELLPDTYAPKPPVHVEDILPFFLPPTAPVSRATYELK